MVVGPEAHEHDDRELHDLQSRLAFSLLAHVMCKRLSNAQCNATKPCYMLAQAGRGALCEGMRLTWALGTLQTAAHMGSK